MARMRSSVPLSTRQPVPSSIIYPSFINIPTYSVSSISSMSDDINMNSTGHGSDSSVYSSESTNDTNKIDSATVDKFQGPTIE